MQRRVLTVCPSHEQSSIERSDEALPASRNKKMKIKITEQSSIERPLGQVCLSQTSARKV
jgi:hypothetical protein